MRFPSPTFEQRFWAKVKKSEDGCWLWTASTGKAGYGKLMWRSERGKTELVDSHRASWMIHFGDIPAAAWVLHRCDVKLCVRPDHLFLGDAQANVDDMHSKGRAFIKPRVTHCSRGHELTPENTIVSKSSRRPWGVNRCCRECLRSANTANAARHRADPAKRAAYNAYMREYRKRRNVS